LGLVSKTALVTVAIAKRHVLRIEVTIGPILPRDVAIDAPTGNNSGATARIVFAMN
jgi:hypothetical protein